MAGIGYRPEIDGLRALAVVPVVMFHLGLGFPGGFVGVDVFFVISGFLITGIIRRGLENETFSLVEFWERRIRRIFPALFVVVAATLAVGYWVLLPNELEELGKSSVAQALLLANVYFWRDTGYFAGPAEFKPLLHTWSLAVEEQFYLFFPFMLCLLRRLSRKNLFAVLAVVALISFAGSVYGAFFHTGATFFLLPTRAWELLIGCMLAVFPWQCKSSPRRDSTIATLGFLAIVLPVFLYDSDTPFPGLAAAPPVFGTAAIIFATACTPSIWLCKSLSLRPFVFIGRISYSLYLWHWPIIVYTRMYSGHFREQQIAFASVVSLSAAILSWRFVETPLRRTTFFKSRRQLFASAFALSGAAIAVSFLFVGSKGCSWRFPKNISSLQEDVTWTGTEYSVKFGDDYKYRMRDLASLGVDGPVRNRELDFVVWGDSHGMCLCDIINTVALDYGLHGKAIVHNSFLPLPNVYVIRENEPTRYRGHVREREKTMEFLGKARPRNLILVACWSRYTGNSDVSLADTQSNFQNGSAIEIIKRNLQQLNSFCLDRGIALWVVRQIPSSGEKSPATTLLRYVVGRTSTLSNQRLTKAEYDKRVAPIAQVFDAFEDENVKFIDPARELFDDKKMTVNYLEGRSLYRDASHVTRWGGKCLRPVLDEMFSEILRQSLVNANLSHGH
ncbi:acyltransferase family protein [Rosistilla oblonga]|uniref:acyltransferase family protein n=1 Tax=Rosistilla oblonga TaxID=2527990 RepID=UPI003A96E0CF